MDFRSDDEKRMDWLEGEIGMLKECIELLASNCSCSVAMRMSGHSVDCVIPKVRVILDEQAAGEDKPYRDPTE